MTRSAIALILLLASPAMAGTVRPLCRPVVRTGVPPWSDPRDLPAYLIAARNCVRHFPASPCLVRFEKVEPGRYRATCGARRQGP